MRAQAMRCSVPVSNQCACAGSTARPTRSPGFTRVWASVRSVMLPAAHITGVSIAVVSGLLAFGAPWIYALLGALLGRRINGTSAFTVFNRCMGLALAVCAYFMFHAFYLHLVAT